MISMVLFMLILIYIRGDSLLTYGISGHFWDEDLQRDTVKMKVDGPAKSESPVGRWLIPSSSHSLQSFVGT